MRKTLTTEETNELMYSAFRRALGGWIVTSTEGEVRFEVGEWADSPSACDPFRSDEVKFVGWIAGSDLGGTGPVGDDVACTATEFAEFLMLDGFVLWGSPAALAAAAEFDEKLNAPFPAGAKITRVR